MRYDAIILAGGAGSRLGGLDKAQLELVGSPLISRPLRAASNADRIVIVGPDDLRQVWPRYLSPEGDAPGDGANEPDEARITVTREEPPGGGPAAATAAGLEALGPPFCGGAGAARWVLLLSCDLPMAESGVQRLIDAVVAGEATRHAAGAGSPGSLADPSGAAGEPPAVDGYCLTDAGGRLQWLFAVYRTGSLRAAVAGCEQMAGTSMRRLLAELHLVAIPDTAGISGDLDTWDDHAVWTARLKETDR